MLTLVNAHWTDLHKRLHLFKSVKINAVNCVLLVCAMH